MTLDDAAAQLGDLAGKTVSIFIDDHLGAAWAHTPDAETLIRFYGDFTTLVESVIENYEDYFVEKDETYFDADLNWTHPTIIPFASVGGGAIDDDVEEFFCDSFAFLFWDLSSGTVVSATTDDWDFKTLGTFADLEQRLRP